MKYEFLNIFLGQKELLAQAKKELNPFLFENNTGQIESFYDYYKSDINLLYVNGSLGTGKAKIVDYSLSFLSKEAIILKYNCFNSTVLDDVLLSFYKDFKDLSTQHIIDEPKIRAENFTQKVNSFFTNIERPFVIILDSFEAILDENRKEILDFIFHLMSLSKIKIIVIGRSFEIKHFQNIELEKIDLYPLSRQIFEKYLKAEKIKASGSIIDEFYKYTKGYYFFTDLSVKIMQNENLSLTDFLIKMTESYQTFNDFLAKRALTLIPNEEKNTYWFLSMLRHPISIELLEKLKLYNEKNINFLIQNLLIIKEDSQIYIRDYLKDFAYDSMPQNIAPKIHQYIIDLYSTQLPLKPLERNICISRQTMRKEIEYNILFLPKRPKLSAQNLDANFLSYSQKNDPPKEKIEQIKSKIEEPKEKSAPPQVDLTQRKNIKINLENLPFQDNPKAPTPNIDFPTAEDESKLDLKGFIKLINRAEAGYQYAKVIELCQKAILLKDDKSYQGFLPMLYVELAYAYQKIANYENSLKYYNFVKDIYIKEGKFVKADFIKLSIARIYFDTYKFEPAKNLLLEIVAKDENPINLKAKAYLGLANIEENLSNNNAAFKYYQTAVTIADDSTDTETLAEIYFKYALALDDKNDIINAVEFYNKCINLTNDSKINKFLSSSYSNIATLYGEKNDIDNAIINFTKAYDTDQQNNNAEGMYYASSKLAGLLKRKDPEKALKYFYTALDSAKLTKDTFYIVSAALAAGDYNYDIKENEIALKYYISAYELAKETFSNDNINKINVRINDIKFKLGVEKFDNLVEIIKQQQE